MTHDLLFHATCVHCNQPITKQQIHDDEAKQLDGHADSFDQPIFIHVDCQPDADERR